MRQTSQMASFYNHIIHFIHIRLLLITSQFGEVLLLTTDRHRQINWLLAEQTLSELYTVELIFTTGTAYIK